MTTPREVRAAGLKKWGEAVALIEQANSENWNHYERDEKYRGWWLNFGSNACSYCDYYQVLGEGECGDCPLQTEDPWGGCSDYWNAITDASKEDFVDAFELNAPLMLKQIEEDVPRKLRGEFIHWEALDRRVIAVAVTRVDGWCAYIGAVPGVNHSIEWHDVHSGGSKLPESTARTIFGYLYEFGEEIPYAR